MPYTLTTPLYYVNDGPHLGSTYTTIACDALARFQRLEGRSVRFITGVDEHGQKIERTAAAASRTPQQHCDLVASSYQEQWQHWDISNDCFIRTSSLRHRQLVETFFQRVEAAGDIRLGHQTGWYCVGCEEFKDELAEVSSPCCPLHHRPLEWRDEQNIFFRLSRYQRTIEELVNSPGFVAPASRQREISNFVAQGLRDFSISRLNVAWGIPVPGYAGHTFYVWFDALLGYLSALLDDGGTIDLDRLTDVGWPASTHIIGKDILRFHAVYWPAMLMSAGLQLPKQVFGHGFLTREGQKMGKSLGNVLDPGVLLKRCGRDAVRWYLLRDIQFGEDGDFQQRRFSNLVNKDLANTIGNLLNRTLSMAHKWFDDRVPTTNVSPEHPLAQRATNSIAIVRRSMPDLSFHIAAEAILQLAIDANGHLNAKAPWKLISQPGQEQVVAQDLYVVLESCRLVGYLLQPLLPDLSRRILAQLPATGYESWLENLTWGLLPCNAVLPEPSPVMQRLELDECL
ncbi:methionine--tRNA ligase [cyanobiont of Ornithocercus magnificus]|nr:methionine--tRNA ligase [cyanobiont of Ornithocercus magnificus]